MIWRSHGTYVSLMWKFPGNSGDVGEISEDKLATSYQDDSGANGMNSKGVT